MFVEKYDSNKNAAFVSNIKKTADFINVLKSIGFTDCTDEVISDYLQNPKNEKNPIFSFMSMPDITLESATALLSTVEKSTYCNKKKVSILDFKSRIDSFVETFADYGLTHKFFVKGMSANPKNPPILNRNCKEIKDNITDLIEAFSQDGFDAHKVTKYATKYFSLFTTNAYNTITNINGVHREFREEGFTKEKYLDMGKFFPGIYASTPESVIPNIKLLKQAFDDDLIKHEEGESFWDVLPRKSIAVTYDVENIEDRILYAKIREAKGLAEAENKKNNPVKKRARIKGVIRELTPLTIVGFFKTDIKEVRAYNKENMHILEAQQSKKKEFHPKIQKQLGD